MTKNNNNEKLHLRVIAGGAQVGSSHPWSKKEYDDLCRGLAELSKGKSYYFTTDIIVKVDDDEREEEVLV